MDLSPQTTDSQTSSETSQPTTCVPSPPDAETRNGDKGEKKRPGRLGSSKSRTGCFNCKRARIKCKENRPSCDYCAHRGLKCEWPQIQSNQVGTLVRKPMASSLPALLMNPQSPAPVFNMQDFRLFNHFIQRAYPHQPVGNDSVWKHEIPSIASDHEYLLHAMLALSASDLASSQEQTPEGTELTSTALAHRVKAITALNSAITAGIGRFDQGNAMIATCFALLFQSTFFDDGLVEYMSFIRGTTAVCIQMGINRMRFLFDNLLGDDNLDQTMMAAPLITPEAAAAACRSFEQFRHLCQSETEIQVYAVLDAIARSLVTSSHDAYMNLRKMYELFSYTMSFEQFREFANPQNEVCKLLQAHFIALQVVMKPIVRKEEEGREVPTEAGDGNATRWLSGLHRNIRRDMLPYYQWTLSVEQEVCQARIEAGY